MTQRLSQKTIQLEEINIWQGWLPEGEDILRQKIIVHIL